MTSDNHTAQADKDSANNELLNPSPSPHQTPRFSRITTDDFKPAFEQALAKAREELQTIIDNPDTPTFRNTVEALERCGTLLNNISAIFFTLNECQTDDRIEALANEIQPELVAFSNDVNLNPTLFERVKSVYDNRNDEQLDGEQSKLLENTYRDFVRNGALLDEQQKERMRGLSTELASLTLRFGQNVLAATNAFTYDFAPSQAELIAELPDFVKDGMAAEAASRGREGWTVTLQSASMVPLLTYSSNRTVKELLWRKSNTRCLGSEYDNTQIMKRIAELRLAIANLLGYPTYADYVLEKRMAGNRAAVETFLDELLDATKEFADRDYRTISEFARSEGTQFDLMPWDWAYYTEKYRNKRYLLNEEEIKPYLELGNVKKGIFLLAEKLYGIRFAVNESIDVYNPEVEAYEVFEGDGRFLGVLYLDFFPRASKRGGAWMTNFREMYTTADGREVRPLVSMCGNFTKPTANAPSLLTFNELETFLHEFGHCLHGLFATGRYESLSGTNVYRDFVELPSQIMENWATEPEFLNLFAVNYLTGEKMPQELIDKIAAAKNYLAAYANVRQISFGLADMAWHTLTEPYEGDAEEFEHRVTAKAQVLPQVDGTAMTPAFTHIFSGGYAAGYYSYKWAEVLEADAFSLFRQNGIFSRETAQSFRDNILSKGGTEHPMELYVRFLGHKPDIKALIDRMNLE